MATDASRIFTQEGAYTFTSMRLDLLLKEVDMRLNGANCWVTFTRTSNLISKIEFFSDAAKTKKVCEQNITRGTGVGGLKLVTQIQTIYYNDDTTEDGQVNDSLDRPNLGTDDIIENCASPFTTTESEKL